MAISIHNIKGRRVEYSKSGNRHGWQGVITKVRRDDSMPGGYEITVQYDNGVTQVYCIEALQYFGQPYRFQDAAGYLKFINDVNDEGNVWFNYVILDAVSLNVVGSGDDPDAVDRVVTSYIERTGRKVVVYKAIATHERDTPPIKTVNLA